MIMMMLCYNIYKNEYMSYDYEKSFMMYDDTTLNDQTSIIELY